MRAMMKRLDEEDDLVAFTYLTGYVKRSTDLWIVFAYV